MGKRPSVSPRIVFGLSLIALAGGVAALSFAGKAPAWDRLPVHHGTAPQPPAIRPLAMPIGTNLDALSYWSPALPLLDLMKSAGPWVPHSDTTYDTGDPIQLDPQGWVERLPDPASGARATSVLVNILHDNPAAQGHTRYAVLYDGKGTIDATFGARVVDRSAGRIDVETGDDGGLALVLTAIDPADHLRNIRVVRADLLPLYRSGQSFDPAYLERIGGFPALRFMDWMSTNILYDKAGHALSGDTAIASAPLLDWRDRPRPEDRSWGEAGHGVPVELLVEIANRTGAEPWFTMPINASDDYVRGFATYVRDHLRPELKMHVELSNEVWNWSFPQAHYAEARAHALFGPDAKWLEWYGMRAAQVGAIWKTVFGEPPTRAAKPGRVAMVFGTQFAWKGLEAYGLDTERWRDAQGHMLHPADYFDEYAVAGYYDGIMNTDEAYETVRGWWRDADGGYGRAVAALKARIAQVNAPTYLYHGEQARRHGLRLVTYEAGYGEFTPPSHRDDQAYTDFLAKLQRRPEFRALETQNYRAFQTAGGALFMNYGIIGTPSKWGNWSALESVRQTSSPRYDAMRAWNAAEAVKGGSERAARR